MDVIFRSFSEDYEDVENLRFFFAYPERNEFTHKSTEISTYPAIRFYPRPKNGGKKVKWINYREEMNEKVN